MRALRFDCPAVPRIERAARLTGCQGASVQAAAEELWLSGAHPHEAVLEARAGLLLVEGWEDVPETGGPLRASEAWSGVVGQRRKS
jgi:hypothetical protein